MSRDGEIDRPGLKISADRLLLVEGPGRGQSVQGADGALS